jgi:hypothetical protein
MGEDHASGTLYPTNRKSSGQLETEASPRCSHWKMGAFIQTITLIVFVGPVLDAAMILDNAPPRTSPSPQDMSINFFIEGYVYDLL